MSSPNSGSNEASQSPSPVAVDSPRESHFKPKPNNITEKSKSAIYS